MCRGCGCGLKVQIEFIFEHESNFAVSHILPQSRMDVYSKDI